MGHLCHPPHPHPGFLPRCPLPSRGEALCHGTIEQGLKEAGRGKQSCRAEGVSEEQVGSRRESEAYVAHMMGGRQVCGPCSLQTGHTPFLFFLYWLMPLPKWTAGCKKLTNLVCLARYPCLAWVCTRGSGTVEGAGQ